MHEETKKRNRLLDLNGECLYFRFNPIPLCGKYSKNSLM